MTPFRPRHFVQMGSDKWVPLWAVAALKPYYIYFRPNMLQTPKMKALKIGKWIIAWKKKTKHFTGVVNDAKSVVGFSPSRQFCVGRNYVQGE